MTLGPRVGIAVPQIGESDGSPEHDLAAYLRRAEDLGFQSLWVNELSSAPILDPLALLSYAAAVTRHASLGIAILLSALRSPLQLAREVATVDRLSGGRLILGLGLGSDPSLYAAHGLSPERRLRRYLDGLDLMAEVWKGAPVSFSNDWWTIESAKGLTPIQRPGPPIWFGARRGPALRRAARRGDGWIISGSAPPEEYWPALAEVQSELEQNGRARSAFTITKRVYLAATERPDDAKERFRGWFAAHYGKAELADSVALVGSPEVCADALRELRTAGVDDLILNPVFDESEQLERLAQEVVPLL